MFSVVVTLVWSGTLFILCLCSLALGNTPVGMLDTGILPTSKKKKSTKTFAVFPMQMQQKEIQTLTHISKSIPQSSFCYKRPVQVWRLMCGQSFLYTKLTGFLLFSLPQPQGFQPMSRESSATKHRLFLYMFLLDPWKQGTFLPP